MVIYTGDIHGSPFRIVSFCDKIGIGKNDTIVLLGDVGANYYGDKRDSSCKKILSKIGANILCIHGNHENRPSNIDTYRLTKWNGGDVWVEDKYPNLFFAKDGEIFDLEGMKHLVIGGAYSVDKYYRLNNGQKWFPDEQPSDKIRAYVEEQIKKPFDIVLSHTCPFKYEPTDMFLPMVDQSTVDASTEHWLDEIEEKIEYEAWFCGHWHTDRRVDKVHFMFTSFESNRQFSFPSITERTE